MKLSTTLNLFILDHHAGMQPYYDELDNYRSLGFDTLDCIFCDAGADSPILREDWLEWGKKIAAYSEKIGISYLQCHLPVYNFANDGRDAAKDMLISRALTLSSVLGAKWTVMHPATDYALASAEESFQKNYDFFAPLVAAAKQQNIGIAIENMADFDEPPFKPWYCARVEELIKLVDALGENCGICWDFGHANLVYADQSPILRQIGSRLKAVHVHDNWGSCDHHLPVFFGSIKWEPLMHTLKEIGYQGAFDFEVKRIDWTLPKYVRNAQWQYVKTTGEYLLSLIGE